MMQIPDEPFIRFELADAEVKPHLHIVQKEQLIGRVAETLQSIVLKNKINVAIALGISETIRRVRTAQPLLAMTLNYPLSSELLIELICHDLETLLIHETVLQGVHLLLTSRAPNPKSGMFQIGYYENFQHIDSPFARDQQPEPEGSKSLESLNAEYRQTLAVLIDWNADTLIRRAIHTTRPPFFFDWSFPEEPDGSPYYIHFTGIDRPSMTSLPTRINGASAASDAKQEEVPTTPAAVPPTEDANEPLENPQAPSRDDKEPIT